MKITYENEILEIEEGTTIKEALKEQIEKSSMKDIIAARFNNNIESLNLPIKKSGNIEFINRADKDGRIISEIEKNHTPKTFNEIKDLFKQIIKKHENDVDVIAFSTCGAVNNSNTGILGSTGNIAEGYPSMDFASLSNKPVFVENDANCAAWAE